MISVVIACAGNHSRFGSNKLFSKINKEPVFIRTVKQFLDCREVDEVILVVRKNNKKRFEGWLNKFEIKAKLVEGGKERFESAYYGVRASRGKWVLVHDGARPLVTPVLIKKVIRAVKKHGAVMTAVEATTCVKLIDPKTQEVKECLGREISWLGQTPHGFRKEIILSAYKRAIKGEISGMDDCELVRKTGVKVKIVPGEWTNKKVTFPTDLAIVRNWVKVIEGGSKIVSKQDD
ncbi:MAG: IspD/TarI family cytidylyltransferase [Candidatus Beckwithbacteria bacterium]